MDSLVYKLIELAGLGGFVVFMFYVFFRRYMGQMTELLKEKHEENINLAKVIESQSRRNDELEVQLIDLLNKYAEVITTSAVSIAKINEAVQKCQGPGKR